MMKIEGLEWGFREDENGNYLLHTCGTNHSNTSGVTGKYFSKTDHPHVRKGAAVLRQEYTIVLTFLSKLTKRKEAGAKHTNCQGTLASFLFGAQIRGLIPVSDLKWNDSS